jgi:NAD(P)-dependent dehydrogenase (short-subunit alcohol dehydrogenase family)
MDVGVDGKIALVRGGNRGIGMTTALEFARSGVRGIAITSRRPENMKAAANSLMEAGVEADRLLALTARTDDEDAADMAVAATVDRYLGQCRGARSREDPFGGSASRGRRCDCPTASAWACWRA